MRGRESFAEVSISVVRLFKGTPAQGIVLKPYGGTLGCAYALEHAVAIPLVSGVSLLPAIMCL